jgi:hypothetical protein
MEAVKTEKKAKKAKKERTFNSTKTARQVEKALKSVFPKGKFFVSDAKPVEVIVKDSNGYTEQEIEMFRKVFCTVAKVNEDDLLITLVKEAHKAAPEASAQTTPETAK